MAIEYFCFYHNYAKKCEKLSDQELGRLVRALLKYSETGEATELVGRESIAFDFIADDIDRAKQSYEEKCRKLSANAMKAVEKKQMDAIATNCYQLDANGGKNKNKNKNNKEKDSTIVESKKKSYRFSPPTLEEVMSYCSERKNSVDARRFMDYYTSNGWMVGKNHMKDWKAAIRTWEKTSDKPTVKTANETDHAADESMARVIAWRQKYASEV